MSALVLKTLEVHGVRNLAAARVDFHESLTVLCGDNGQGKTNLLEAIYLGATGRSFRTSSLDEIPRHGQSRAFVELEVHDARDELESQPRDPLLRKQSIALLGGKRACRLGEKPAKSLSVFALASPVVIFSPASLTLSQGPASERRKLLDRVAMHRGEPILEEQERYNRALTQRKRGLEVGASSTVLGSFEQVMAQSAVKLFGYRERAAQELAPHVLRAFERIAGLERAATCRYLPKGGNDEEAFRRALFDLRAADTRRRAATHGPHLDDLELSLGGHLARAVASQGQHRALVLSLKSAELSCIRQAREIEPILLLDDVSSELDETRNSALFQFLAEREGQVILTTTRPELVAVERERLVHRIEQGVVTRPEIGQRLLGAL